MAEKSEAQQPLSVSDAVALAKGAVSAWPSLVVNGEVSGFRGPNARSGHCYFEVKDDGASMSVIVWRGTAAKMGFQLRDGLAVQLTGKFDVYKASGKLSFVASRVEAAGEGLLRQQVAELARRLEAEGLMDAAPILDPRLRGRKKEIMQGDAGSLINMGTGCRFAPRCRYAGPECRERDPEPVTVGEDHQVACFHPLEI